MIKINRKIVINEIQNILTLYVEISSSLPSLFPYKLLFLPFSAIPLPSYFISFICFPSPISFLLHFRFYLSFFSFLLSVPNSFPLCFHSSPQFSISLSPPFFLSLFSYLTFLSFILSFTSPFPPRLSFLLTSILFISLFLFLTPFHPFNLLLPFLLSSCPFLLPFSH